MIFSHCLGNIGLSRNFDSRWVTQYGSLFCVMNHMGQIMTWRLTQGVAFAKIEGLLTALQERLLQQGKQVTEFYIDNCCAWSRLLQGVFGDGLKVYLDLFHAVKRISDKIPKRHPLRKECVEDLRMVFRDPTDQGSKRTKETPSAAILIKNIRNFEDRWKSTQSAGKMVLNQAAIKEIRNLEVHMNKGCLSGIKPGRGTNRNEALHRRLNHIMCASRYGVELAYALLTTYFYQHNEKMLAKAEKRAERPIFAYQQRCTSSSCLTTEKFGLAFPQPVLNTAASCSQSNPPNELPLQLKTSNYDAIKERILTTSHSILGSTAKLTDDDASHESSSDSNTDDDDSVALEWAKTVLLQALAWYYIYEQLSGYSSTAYVKCGTIPFMNSALTNLFMWSRSSSADTDSEKHTHEHRLDSVLKSWNFERIAVPSDGDCLFASVVLSIKELSQRGITNVLQHMSIDPKEQSNDDIVCLLRKAVVDEWLGDNTGNYQAFLTSDQLHKQARSFLKNGTFAGDIGDLVVQALANVLKSPIVVFTSVENMPTIVITPPHVVIENAQPLHLAYNAHGPGHYDAAVWVSPDTQPEELSEEAALPQQPACSCGRKSTKGTPCSLQLNIYTTRCPCYNLQSGCNHKCRCKNCQNPYGIRLVPAERPSTGSKRKYEAHRWQKQSLKGTKAMKFMDEVDVPVKTGTFSTTETLLVSAIIQNIYNSDPQITLYEIDSLMVHSTYNTVRKVAEALNLQLPIHERLVNEIVQMCQSYFQRYDLFDRMHI